MLIGGLCPAVDRSGKVLRVNSGDDNTGAEASVEVVNPWEERKDRGRVSALAATLILLATSPRRFFEATKPEAGIWGPLFFAGLVGIISVLLNGVVLTVLTFAFPEPAVELLHRMEIATNRSQLAGPEDLPFGPALNLLIILQLLLLTSPLVFVLALLTLLVYGGIVHLLLIVTRTPRPRGFRGTWVAICYANGAGVLGIVPFAGDLAAAVCGAVLFGIGLHVVQGAGVVRAAILASILPMLALLGLLARFIVPSL